MEEQHILNAFDKSMQKLDKLLRKMHKQLLKQHQLLQSAYQENDKEQAAKIVEKDSRINLLEFDVNRRALRTLLRHQPMAKDLRFVFSVPKIASNLERMGDNLKNIAKLIMQDTKPMNFGHSTISAMLQTTQEMQIEAMKAWLESDSNHAVTVRAMDQKVDELYEGLSRELLTWMMEDSKNISSCLAVMQAARHVERIGDYITNICEDIYFVETGVMLEQMEEQEQQNYHLGDWGDDGADISDNIKDDEDDDYLSHIEKA